MPIADDAICCAHGIITAADGDETPISIFCCRFFEKLPLSDITETPDEITAS
jgi:hypothetical protein